ncbi:hypothetical protein HanRHA438_Chr03g0129191 [Helianthus annuus]|nr:hypothetical protein HanRHA438_Chr03g0129191 [Helianthus annuus]KAJ0944227.1 hypothetical protein HanPSC8_Chr03g0113861 [Helianthus annuus]
MAKKPKSDGYTRNPKHTGRVYPKPNGYGPGTGLKKEKNRVRVWDLMIPARYPAHLPE